ncbi:MULTISPECIES: plasmid mobilization protein [Pseudomonas]|uniref:plasmid mobilization protein n=1 Tax=Pseudomonas TaxID=286 RepID=UPI0005702827|nr:MULTISPECIES: CopG family transcriptional regulator [Pseudomonas]WOB59915.1 CopG family transcriptional regulator [Pseudomonas sp. NBB]
MTEDTKGKAQPRRRGKPIEVWVTDEEKATITERAEEAGMSRSGYLRALGLNTPMRSVVDLKAVSDLAKVNGDLGRAAGLLKLWLVKRPGGGIRPINLDALISDFRTLQSQILNLMSQIVNNKK